MDTGKRFKKLRNSLGFNQMDFAKFLGTSQQVISAIERGKYGISKEIEHALRIKCPDMDIDYITGLRDHPVSNTQAQATAHDAVILITKHNQANISNKIKDGDWLYEQPRVVADLPSNAQYLAIEMPSDTMVNDTPDSINPGDIIIGALMNTLTINNKAVFAIAEGLQIVCGLLTSLTEQEIKLTPANPLYDSVTISKSALLRVYRIIELHTRRHSL